MKIGFIGAGIVGNALATKLGEQGYRVAAVYSRSRTSAERLSRAVIECVVCDSKQTVADIADIVFITTPDAVIPTIAKEIEWRAGQTVVHCSGADSTEVLLPAKLKGANTVAFHPLQTFASVKQAIENLPGTTFALEANEPLKATFRDMAVALGGVIIELDPGDKVIYHAAAVMACNYLVTLIKLAGDLWEIFGVTREQAAKALLPLIHGTLNNIQSVGIPQSLTGPVARGDLVTIQKHLLVLKREATDVLSTYCELGLQTVPIALAKGKIDERKADELRALFKSAFKSRILEDKATTTNDILPVL